MKMAKIIHLITMKLSLPGRFNETHPAGADKENRNPTENH